MLREMERIVKIDENEWKSFIDDMIFMDINTVLFLTEEVL